MSVNKKDLNEYTKAELEAHLCELFGSLKNIGLDGLKAVAKARKQIAIEKAKKKDKAKRNKRRKTK